MWASFCRARYVGWVAEWLSNLPDTVVEDVVQTFQARLENCLMDGMEEMLSRIRQNSYNIEMVFSFFGVNSMLTVVQGFQINSLQFSKCLLFWDEKLPVPVWLTLLKPPRPELSDKPNNSLFSKQPHTPHNYQLPRKPHLSWHFQQQGSRQRLFTPIRYQTRNLFKSLKDRFEDNHSSIKPDLYQLESKAGCPKLEHLNLHCCENVTEKGLMYVNENLKNLKNLEYQQKSSVLEVIIKWSVRCLARHWVC